MIQTETDTKPVIAYEPEPEILTISADLTETDVTREWPDFADRIRELRYQHLEALQASDGVEVVDNDGQAQITVAIDERFAKTFEHRDDRDVAAFLNDLQPLLPERHEDADDSIDHIVDIELVCDVYARGRFSPFLRQWLSTPGILTPDMARQSIAAMATPFGERSVRRALSTIQFESHVTSDKARVMGGFMKRTPLFGIEVAQEIMVDQPDYAERSLRLQAIGSYALWGVNELEEADRLIAPQAPPQPELTIQTKNPREMLAVLLGLGVIARHAVEAKQAATGAAEARTYRQILPFHIAA